MKRVQLFEFEDFYWIPDGIRSSMTRLLTVLIKMMGINHIISKKVKTILEESNLTSVVDLGSGAGNDVFVARKIVGDNGHVIGVDMTEAMVTRAKENKEKLGYTNVEFVLGEIEDLPVEEIFTDFKINFQN